MTSPVGTFTVGKRLALGFGIVLFVVATLSTFALFKLQRISTAVNDAATDSLPGVRLSLSIADAQNASYGLVASRLLAKDPAEASRIDAAIKAGSADISALIEQYRKTVLDETDRLYFEAMQRDRAAWVDARGRILELAAAGRQAEAIDLFRSEGRDDIAAFEKVIGAMVDENIRDSDASVASVQQTTSSGRAGVVACAAVAAVVSLASAVLTGRGMGAALRAVAGNLSVGAEQVASAAAQVSATSQSLAQGASAQAASLEESSASLEEMHSMTQKTSETARQATTLAAAATQAAEKGDMSMARMSTAIEDIQKSSAETAKILKTIDEIAFQTNLLALNAAVEAARAGEAGKGFAVVAEEVRNLAMRSAEAARTTALLIDGAVQNAKNGGSIADEVATSLADITLSVRKVNALIGEIAAAADEQSSGIGQVNRAVQEMDKITQSNAASAEEAAASSEELSSQSEQVIQAIAKLNALVGRAGERRDQGRRPRQPVRAMAPATAADPRRITPNRDEDFSDFNIAA